MTKLFDRYPTPIFKIGQNIVQLKLQSRMQGLGTLGWRLKNICFDFTRRHHVTRDQCQLTRAFAFRCKQFVYGEIQLQVGCRFNISQQSHGPQLQKSCTLPGEQSSMQPIRMIQTIQILATSSCLEVILLAFG